MNEEGNKTDDVRERTFNYALRSIKLYQALQKGKDGAGWIIGKQYLKSATSVGADIEEAQSEESRTDFIHKCSIAQKDARESMYWLRLLDASEMIRRDRLSPLLQETEEIISIITPIIKTAKENTEE